MSKSPLNLNLGNVTAQDLLNQILSSGRDLIEQGKAKSDEIGITEKGRAVANKGKELAAKSEDELIKRFGLEDTPAVRAALRKGVSTGAAAGAIALLLSSRSGRKLAKIGGVAALGTLAFKAYKNGKLPTNKDEVIGLLTGESAEQRAIILLKAMVAAAHADGKLNDEERAMINAYDDKLSDSVEELIASPLSVKELASLSTSSQTSHEIYAVSARIANGLNLKERAYLDKLAIALRLDPEVAARIETDIRN